MPTSLALGPTARAPAAGANFQSPAKADIDETVPEALVAATTIEVGAVTTGAVRSAIVNTAVALPSSCEESCMKNLTVVAPNGKTSGASLPISALVSAPSTLSKPVTESSQAATSVAVLAAPSASVAAIVVASGAVITGGD